MRKNLVLVVATMAIAATAACSAETSPTTEPAALEVDSSASVEREGDTVHVQFGTDEMTTNEVDGRRSVNYFHEGTWVGTIGYRASDRSFKMSAPGFEREQILPFDLDARIRESQEPESLMTMLGITEDDKARYLGGLMSTDARFAANPNVARAMAAQHGSASGIRPQRWRMCRKPTLALACAVATAGLCGYAMIFNCLVLEM